MSGWGQRALISGAVVVVAVACIDLGGPKGGVVSISGLGLPSPSVVLGDMMRDSLGIPAPLSITAFDDAGNPIPGEPVAFVALDTTISVDVDGLVRGLFRDSLGGRVVAGAGSLQTLPARIIVTVKPDTAIKGTEATQINFDLLADTTSQTNRSPLLAVTVTGAGGVGAQGFIVSYEITRSPPPRIAGVPTAYLADEGVKASTRDTTDLRGAAGRRVIFRANLADAELAAGTRTDTVVVRATVRYAGADVAGSPVDFIIPVKKK